MLKKTKNIYLIGIGGIGMSGIAKLLYSLGYLVSGYDAEENKSTKSLKALGIKINSEHKENNLDDVNLVVKSSAIKENNHELIEAKKRNILIVSRAEMLAELMRFTNNILISGTHGKTTTTSITTNILLKANLKPSFMIGGILNELNTNASLGNGKYFVAEADESDASFLVFQPYISIITNIDAEHMATYEYSLDKLKSSFIDFANKTSVFGTVILGIDNENSRQIKDKINRKIITYGFSNDADCKILDVSLQKSISIAKFEYNNKILELVINMPGKHNIQNAMSAFLAATELGICETQALEYIKDFSGVGRRFQMIGNYNHQGKQILLVDDYGHHPEEVLSTINAVREGWKERQVIVIFQPHRYSRTQDFFNEFAEVLSKADVVLLLDVFAAGEMPLEGITSENLIKKIKTKAALVKENVFETLKSVVTEDSVVITQGAGNVTELSQILNKSFNEEKVVEI